MKAPGKARRAGRGRGFGTEEPLAAAGTRSDHVQSLVRALGIINQLAAADEGMTLTRIAECVGLPPSTAHRLLTTLEQERYVHFDHERRLWSVGVQAFMTGAAFLRTRDLVGIARPYMRALMNESTETVNLAIEDENEAIYLAQVECRQMMRALARPGARVPLYCSSVGKALLCATPDGDLAEALQRQAMRRVTEKTIVNRTALRDELALTRERGFRHRRRRARLWASLRRRAGVRRVRRANGRDINIRADRAHLERTYRPSWRSGATKGRRDHRAARRRIARVAQAQVGAPPATSPSSSVWFGPISTMRKMLSKLFGAPFVRVS